MIDGIKSSTSTMNGAVVVGSVINEAGHLIITLSNGKVIDAGFARGPVGPAGKDGEQGEQGLKGNVGEQGSKGDVGPQGEQGPAGINGQSFEVDRVGYLASKSHYDAEARGFAYLQLPDAGSSQAYLWIKRSDSVAHWSDPIPFNEGRQGERGEQGPKGEQGERGLEGRPGDGLKVDAYGRNYSELTAYDNVTEGFTFWDISENVLYVKQSDAHKDWKKFKYFEGEAGPQGLQGETGAIGDGLKFDIIINDPFEDVKGLTDWADPLGTLHTFATKPKGTVVLSTVDFVDIHDQLTSNKMRYNGVFYQKLSDTDNFWSQPQRYGGPMGQSGKDGNGLHVDTSGRLDELRAYDKKPHGFTFLAVDTQQVFVKKEDYPYPGQDPYLDYSLPQYNTTDYLNQKVLWDRGSESQRFALLWSTGTLALGPQGEQGPAGPQGLKGEDGLEGPAGARGYSMAADHKAPGLTERHLYDNDVAGTSYLDTTRGVIYFRQTTTPGVWGPGIPMSSTNAGNVNGIDYIAHDLQNNRHGVLQVSSQDEETQKNITRDVLLPGTSYITFDHDDFVDKADYIEASLNLGQIQRGSYLRMELDIITKWDGDLLTDVPDPAFPDDLSKRDPEKNINMFVEFRQPSTGTAEPDHIINIWENYVTENYKQRIFNGTFTEPGIYELLTDIVDPDILTKADGGLFDIWVRIKATKNALVPTDMPTDGKARLYLHRS